VLGKKPKDQTSPALVTIRFGGYRLGKLGGAGRAHVPLPRIKGWSCPKRGAFDILECRSL
jgi:hypothetical protein